MATSIHPTEPGIRSQGWSALNVNQADVTGVLKDPVLTIRDGKRLLHELDHVPLAYFENWATILSTVCRPARLLIRIA
ncbi:MAG: hypothetical protein CME19_01945 [Gemmatimonadetes bacterium]|nr:hypothetical protein [Gemmatimonadota bacterium]